MKYIALLTLLVLVAVPNSWAARAKINPVAADPYVSALLIDAESGKVLLSENAEATVYPASVVKLMDLLVVLERIEKGLNRLDEMVQITSESARMGGSQVYLDPKEQFTIDELLYALMVQSANDAATALAIHIAGSKTGFVKLMNQKAAELGMKNTRFSSVHGLPPSEGQDVDRTTASDLALLCRALVSRPDVIRYTSTQERGFRNDSFIMRNHNNLLGSFAECDGLKTGYFKAAGFSIAATALRAGNRVIAIVMGSSDRKVRDAKTAELLAKGLGMLPPKPESIPSVTPQPAAPVVPVAVETVEKVAEIAEAPEPAAVPEAPVEVETESSGGFQWGTFLLGMIAGIFLCAMIARVRRKNRPLNRYR